MVQAGRWYYRFKSHGLAGLVPGPRSGRGRAKALTAEQRELICELRREHPSASAELLLRGLVAQGRVAKGGARTRRHRSEERQREHQRALTV